MKTIKLNILLICILGLLSGSNSAGIASGGSAADAYPAVEMPIFQGGYDIKKSSGPAGRSKTLSYRVKITSPAAGIIEFYDSYFNGRGWISSFEICQRHWDVPAHNPATDTPPVKRMFASWIHPGFELKVVLWLKQDISKKHNIDEVNVECRLQPKTGK